MVSHTESPSRMVEPATITALTWFMPFASHRPSSITKGTITNKLNIFIVSINN